MSVLILKNTNTEGPGTLEDFLLLKGLPYRIVDMQSAESMPDTAGFDTLVMLGGPMSVNDDIAYIRDEERLANGFMAAGKKVLGICLGAQIMAKALGSKLYKGPATETGWHDITLCDKGLSDPQMIYDWMSGEDICMNALNAETGRLYDIYKKRAFAFYRRFFG
jgi:GMP synthase-like glutamine amidotransferase